MFIATVRPLLRDQCEVQLRIRREGEAIAVTVIPKIAKLDPETSDETIAALQAALAKPFHLTIAANEDPDQALNKALRAIGTAQAAVQDDLDKYTAQIEADRAAAKAAQEKKQAEAKAKGTKKPAHELAKTAAKAPVTKAAAASIPAKAPEPVAAVDLFSTTHAEPVAASDPQPLEADSKPAESATAESVAASTADDDGWGIPDSTPATEGANVHD
jgi:PRTRC genetic system protein E